MNHGIDDILTTNYLDQALDQVSDGVAIFDADDRLIMSNENYKSLYGKHREIVVPGATFDALIRASMPNESPIWEAGKSTIAPTR